MPIEPEGWPGGRHICGIDLGQSQDYTAVGVLKRSPVPGQFTAAGDGAHRLDVVHLHRYPLGQGYPDIVRSVSELVRRPELLWDPGVIHRRPDDGRFEDPLIVIDATGVGRAVVDMFLEADLGTAEVLAVTITSGHDATEEPWHGTGARHAKVPKLMLVSVVQAGIQSGRLKIIPSLPFADTLRREMLAFKCKVNVATGRESFEAWRERDHDDILLSVAIAAWAAARPSRRGTWGPDPFGDDWR